MCRRVPFLLIGLVCGLQLAFGQASPSPEWKYGQNFRVRKAGEKDFTKDTQRFGAEVFIDKNNGQWVMITEAGALTSLKGPASLGKETIAPKWQHGMDLAVRKAGEDKVGKDTKRYGVEVFRDENSGQWVYISETGAAAMLPATGGPTTGDPKEPKFLYGLELKCRRGGEVDFTKDTKRYGIEVFRDENNGNLVYVTESGVVGVVPGAGIAPPAKIASPKWLHGLDLRARKAGESDWAKARNFGAEIYLDENTKQLIFICETGAIAVAPAGSISGGGDTKRPNWTHGQDLACRKADEPEFTKDTKRHGIEVFQDPNTNVTIYITETGSLAVPGK